MVTRMGEREIGAVSGRVGMYAVVRLKNDYTPNYIIITLLLLIIITLLLLIIITL